MTGRRDIRPSVAVQGARVVRGLVHVQLYSRVGIGSARVKILGRRTRWGSRGSRGSDWSS